MINWQLIGGGMKTILDRFGRVVVPKEIRDRLGLKPGAEMEIDENGSEVVLKPVEHETPLKLEDGVLVFRGIATADLIEATRKHRQDRLLKISSGKKP
jgi:AbrB family looped-hinge helix DNA binding protein